jgi:hypothetical protein
MVRAEFQLAAPDLQIGFAHRLVALRYARPALLKAVSTLQCSTINSRALYQQSDATRRHKCVAKPCLRANGFAGQPIC